MPGLIAALTPALDVAAGATLVAGGIAARRHGAGRLLAVTGTAWLAGDVAPGLLYAHRGPLVHLLLTYPDGGRPRRAALLVVIAAYADGLVPPLARSPLATALLAATVLALVAWRVVGAAGLRRRARGASLPAALVVCGALAAGPGWVYDLAVLVSAAGLAADLRWGRWTEAAMTGLVVDLGDEPGALEAALARTLGDPRLRLAFRFDGWVDETGSPVANPTGAGVTFIDGDEGPIAALVHDPAVPVERDVLDAVSAAVRLVAANVRMRKEVAARAREVAASRRRLVEAADEERSRLGEELHAGVERRLAATALRLVAHASDPAVARLAGELDATREEVRAFAHGIHPRVLTERGLAAALGELAARAPAPVRLDVDPGRFPPSHESAAYFVCSEALANVAKYAHADRVQLTVARSTTRLVVHVDDNGIGGADAARGTGLRGLADRLDALGGTLRVESPPGKGTRVRAELPIGAP